MIGNLDLKWNKDKHVNTVVFRKCSTITGVVLILLTVKTCIELTKNLSWLYIILGMIPFIEILHATLFVNLCYVLRERFAELTKELSRHLSKNHCWTQRIASGDISTVKQIHVENSRYLSPPEDIEMAYTALELEELRCIYDSLCDIVDKMNSVFGFRLLVTIAHKFCEIVQDLFALTVLLDSFNKSTISLFISLYEPIFYSAVIITLVCSCVSPIKQVCNT